LARQGAADHQLETHGFESWSMLIALLVRMLLATEATPGERALPRDDETHS
jgi:hypothetical protein